MNNGLLFLGGFLVAILAALFAVPNFVDWNSYRGVFEEEASKVLGRDVRVGGNVNLKILPVPYVRFEKIRIASVSGQTGEPFVRADSFTMWLSVPALLRGVIEASQVELEKPILSLSIDEDGVGNWAKLELRPGELPFVPRDVALRSVRITDGAISLYNAASAKIGTVDGIDGVFSADGLKGPFRYAGAASWGGVGHDVKFATDVPASDGAFTLKLSANADRSPDTFILDGRVYNIAEKTKFEGQWSGNVLVPGTPSVEPNGTVPPIVNIKSDVTADAQGAKFENLSLTLDNAAEQTISGSAVASWVSSPRLDVSLNSKWLDVDWLAGAGKDSAGFSKLKRLALGLMQSVAGDSTASAKIKLDQVKIGGENSGGLSIDADRQGSITHFKTLKVSLPGGSRLDLAGDLKNNGGKLSFTGNAFIGGSSFQRFKAWADKSGIPVDVNADGPYSVAGKIDIDDTRFVLTNASGDISGRPLAGDLKIVHGDRERTELTLQAADLDTREVFPEITEALRAEFRKSLGLPPPKGDKTPETELPGDVRLRVIAGHLTDGNDTYRDVDVSLVIEGKRLSLPVANLTTDGGLEIGLEGRLENKDNGPVGTLAYDVVGTTPDAMKDLVRKTGLIQIIGDEQFKGLKEGKIAGLIEFGRRAPTAADVTFDGLLNGSKFGGKAEFDGGFEGWQTHESQLQATLEAPSLGNLLTVLGRDGGDAFAQPEDHPARASLISAGVLQSDSLAQIQVTSQDFDMRFQGHALWPARSELALNGKVDITTTHGEDALAVAGLSLPGQADGVAMKGSLDVRRENGAWKLAGQKFQYGASVLSGQLTAASQGGGWKIDGNLLGDRISIPALLSAVTDAPADTPQSAADGKNAAAAQAAQTAPPVWPEGLFDFAALGNTTANLNIGFKSLAISGDLATGDGTMTLALKPGKLTIADLKAHAAGGNLTGQASLEKVSNGVAFASDIKLDQAKLERFNASGEGSGTFGLHMDARAQSPAGLIAVMTGSGTAKFAKGEMPGPSPEAVADVVDDVFAGKVQNDPQAIGNAVVTAVALSKLPLGNRDFAVSVTDGTLKLSGLDFESEDGKVEGTVTGDLASLAMSASYQVTAKVRPLSPATPPTPNRAATARAPKGPLPPVLVLYGGQLDQLASLSVNADVGDLQRELVVRQMERNVEELEQARRADEERARLEKEMERKRKEAAAKAAAEQKAIQQQQLPPVVPAPAGTPNSSSGPSANNPDYYLGTPPAPQPSNSANPVPQSQTSTPPAAGATGSDQRADSQPGAIDPATGLPIQAPAPTPSVKPSVARTTPPRRAKQRTSSDEVMKSLGSGFFP